MLQFLTNICLTVMDFILGWSLSFPKIVPLILLGIGEALVITLIQKYATNQDMLKRMKFDRDRLKVLTKEAKQRGDKEAVKRQRSTGSMIGGRLMKAEILPIVLSVLPIAFIATWAFTRMPFMPIRPSQAIVIEADFPTAEIGNIVSMVPPRDGGVESSNGWIQKIVERFDDDDPVTGATRVAASVRATAPAAMSGTAPATAPDATASASAKHTVIGGKAIWQLQPAAGTTAFALPIRYKGESFIRKVNIGHPIYEPPIEYIGASVTPSSPLESIEVKMTEYMPLGILPSIGPSDMHAFWHIPPWLVGDLIIVIPLSLLFRPMLRVY